ncbi:(d)CMP kinase [Sphingomonas sp. SUN039]|uniref:(d)CMP kinase n=1 Tax=Sphingomonas sp. SUN039 TaxID=2937787 RepID=UPI002164D0A5|nr:(d)CMP kinase [Sphingomonas sp. SUN039]UVO54160.1 (d)CMP kinase [Sphingomonas sp. SUN039]
MIIAVDGPAASGKGTIARALAGHFDLPHLDTGLLYRAVGLSVLRHGGDPAHEIDALRACGFSDAMLHDPDIRCEAASKAASVVSAHPAVRTKLLQRQLDFASQPGGAVLDGRDIGTVIAPAADAKLFVTATPDIRAKRRFAQLVGEGSHVAYDHVLTDILDRDARDSGRDAAPLRQADDAVLVDTSAMGIAEAVAEAIRLVETRRT